MPRSYSKTVHIRAPGARSLAILAVAAILVSGVVVGWEAVGGSDVPTTHAREASVVEATPLAATPEAESPAPEAPEGAIPEDVISVAESPATVPDAAQATQQTAPSAGEAPQFMAGEAVVVNADALNVRTEPGLSGDVAVVLPPGLRATVMAGPSVADGFTWYQLDASGVIGWSAGEFLAPAGSILAFAAQAPTVPLFPVGSPVLVADGDLYLRAEPGLGGAIQDHLQAGTAATVVDGPAAVNGYTWYQLDGNGFSGWSAGEFLAATPIDTAAPEAN